MSVSNLGSRKSCMISRRQVLKTVGFASGALLVAACSAPAPAAQPAAPAATSAASSAPAAAGQKKKGGIFRMAHNDDFTTLDVALAYSYVDWWASAFMLYNRLYSYDNALKFGPDLAADMPTISADGLTVTIPLKKGVKFHNGQEMTAEDVKFSIERSASPTINTTSSYIANIVGIKDVTAGKATEAAGIIVKDPYTIELKLSEPQPTLVYNFAVSVLGIAPKKAIQDAGADWGTKVVISTGPYKLTEWKTGEKITFERYQDYFNPLVGFVDKIEINQKVEPEQQVLRWEAGELEYAVNYPSAELARIQGDETLKQRLVSGKTVLIDYLTLRNAAPIDDLNVRKAIAFAIDKQAIVDKVRTAAPLNRLYPDGFPNVVADFTSQYPYDPEKAKAALAESKYKDGVKLAMWAFQNNEVAEMIQADLKEVGIELEVQRGDYGSFKPKFDSGEVQMNMNGFGADVLDPSLFVQDRILCAADAPAVTFCDPQVKEWYDKTTTLPPDSKERLEVFRQLEDFVVNQAVTRIPLTQRDAFGLSQTYMKDMVIHPIFGLPDPQIMWLDR